jgi:maltose alpha-D-glucosyltransferase / alpha-amylase
VHLREHAGETVLLVHNLAPSAEAVELDLAEFRGAVPVELLGGSRFPAVVDRPYVLTMAPHGSYWLRLDRPGRPTVAYGIERDSV